MRRTSPRLLLALLSLPALAAPALADACRDKIAALHTGSLETVTLDASSGEAIRFERTEFVNSWTEGVSMQVWVSENTYDTAIKLRPPE